ISVFPVPTSARLVRRSGSGSTCADDVLHGLGEGPDSGGALAAPPEEHPLKWRGVPDWHETTSGRWEEEVACSGKGKTPLPAPMSASNRVTVGEPVPGGDGEKASLAK